MRPVPSAALFHLDMKEKIASELLRILQLHCKETKIKPSELSSRAVAVSEAIRSAATSLKLLTRKRWNAERLINQLPDEVLVLIFHMVLDDFPDESKRRMGRSSYLTIQQGLRSVCSLWRNIISSSRSFWTTLSCLDVGRKRFKLALSKAEGTGCRAICRRSGYCSKFVAKVIALSDRWESIDVFDKHWIPFTSHPFPNLQRLRIIRRDQTFETIANFQDIFPRLVELRLEGIVFQNMAPTLNLRTLAVHGKGRTFHAEALIQLISNSSMLKRMEIVGVRLWIAPDRPLPSASALKLRSITIERVWPYNRLACFLSHLELSPDACVVITLIHEMEDVIALSEYARHRIALVEGNPPLRVDLRQIARPCFELRVSENHIPLRITITRRSWPAAWMDCRRMLQSWNSVVTGGRMLELRLPSTGSLAQEAIRVISVCLPHVTTLELWGSEGPNMLAKRGPDGQLPFPRLSRLHINGAVDDDNLVWMAAIRKADTQVRTIESLVLDGVPGPGRVGRLKHVFLSVESSTMG